MFRSEGIHRSPKQNQRIAGYLGAIAGFVNSAGFVLVGSFTSHVTGNIGRLADDLALGHASAATLAAIMVIAFFAGAFGASVALESNVVRKRTTIYALLLFVEAGLLAMFALLAFLIDTQNARYHDLQAILLCLAMGLQNSLVTRLSGAVVRTTHLTGIVTDIAIEGARWFRTWRAKLAAHTKLRLVMGDHPTVAPNHERTVLWLTIVVTFVLGAAAGAIGATYLGSFAMLAPTGALVVASLWARRS